MKSGLLFALVVAGGCHGARPTPPARVVSPTPSSEPTTATGVARLFAGKRGTCRITPDGRVRCWGIVPDGVEALARAERAQQLVFFGSYEATEPYCVLNENGRATCHVGCASQQGCPQALQTVKGVRSLHASEQSIALVRDDGTMCVVAGAKLECHAARLYDYEGEYMSDPAPGELVDLTTARPGRGLRLPNGVSCDWYKPDYAEEFPCRVPASDDDSSPFPSPVRAHWSDITLLENGTVWAMGGDVDAQDDLLSRRRPALAAVAGFSGIRELAANELLLCGSNANGEVSCVERATRWGAFAVPGRARAPHPVPPLACAEQLVSGDQHVCAQSCDDRTYCWGQNDSGQLAAVPPAASSHTLEQSGVTQLCAGGQRNCVVSTDGSVKCWGSAHTQQLGGPIAGPLFSSPRTVTLPTKAHAVSCGEWTACALLDDGRVSCWGRGYSDTTDVKAKYRESTAPYLVEGVDKASQVVAGNRAGCALVDGQVHCWGWNDAGQRGLGNDAPAAETSTATVVPDVQGAIDVDVGGSFACAVLSDGHVKCWGRMSGSTKFSKPTALPGVFDAVDVTCSGDGYCVRSRSGAVSCTKKAGGPLIVRWPSGVQSVAAPIGSVYDDMCALMLDGSVKCSGQLATYDLVPHVQALNGLRSLAVGDGHACALRVDSQVVCVGHDGSGQLGTGRLLASSAPVLVP